jgi:hypothetical protein
VGAAAAADTGDERDHHGELEEFLVRQWEHLLLARIRVSLEDVRG